MSNRLMQVCAGPLRVYRCADVAIPGVVTKGLPVVLFVPNLQQHCPVVTTSTRSSTKVLFACDHPEY